MDHPSKQRGRPLMPLLAETLLILAAAYLLGVALAWLLFGREKKDSYL